MDTIFTLLDKYKKKSRVLSLEEERELIVKYVHSTNKLEGNSLTLAQTKSIIEEDSISGNNVKTKDILEQKGTYKAVIRMLNAVINKEELSIELLKELNWLTIEPLFLSDYYLSYKEAGQKFGEFKIKNNRILITLPNGTEHLIEPLSTPKSVATNMNLLISRIKISDANIIDKASFLAQEIWLHQPFIDGNKRTARLLVNFLTMKEGFPLFAYNDKGAYFNDVLINQYTSKSSGLIQEFITQMLRNRINELLNQDASKLFRGHRFIL